MQVTAIAAQSIDGFIARSADDRSFDWTSSEDKQFYVDQLKQSDAIIMGSKTFATFSRYPKGAHFVILTQTPEIFVNPRPEVIQVTATAGQPEEVLRKLADQGVKQVLVAGGSSVYRQFLAAGVVDRLLLSVEPVLFGQGVSLCDRSLGTLQLKLEGIKQLSAQTLVLEYRRAGH